MSKWIEMDLNTLPYVKFERLTGGNLTDRYSIPDGIYKVTDYLAAQTIIGLPVQQPGFLIRVRVTGDCPTHIYLPIRADANGIYYQSAADWDGKELAAWKNLK